MGREVGGALMDDAYERLLTQYQQLLADHLDALARLQRLREATKFLVAAACRVAGEYKIPVRATNDPLQPLTADVALLLGTATYRAIDEAA